MKPLALVLEAFGPYPGEQAVDFEALLPYGLFLIHGPTGSGKSTLLDAITFALFDPKGGSVERSGADFVSTLDPGAHTCVTFEFEHLGRRYRIQRRPAQQRRKKTGEGFTNAPAEALLEDLTEPAVLADKATEATRRIEELLHMNVEQFRQTVLLPQGEFRKVITDARVRREVLARIFETHRFARVTERLKEASSALERSAEALQDRRAELLDQCAVASVGELEERVRAAKGTRDAAAARRDEADRERAAAASGLAVAEALERRFDELERKRLAAAALEARAAAMEVERARLEAGRRAARVLHFRVTHERELERAAGAGRQLDEARAALEACALSLEKAGADLDAEAARTDEREAAGEQLRTLQGLREPIRELASLRAREAVDAEALESAQAGAAELEAALEALLGTRAELLGEREARSAEQTGEGETRSRLDELGAQERALDELAHAMDEIATQRSALGGLRAEQEASRDWLRDLRRHAAGVLAADLADGEPCPVCGSASHPHPHAVADADVIAAAFGAYREENAVAASHQVRLEQAEKRVAAIDEAQGWRAGGRPDPHAVRAELGAARERLRTIEAARARVGEIDLRLQELAGKVDAANADRSRLSGEVGGAGGRLQATREAIARLGERIEPDLLAPGAFEERMAAAEAGVRSLADALQAAQTDLAEVQRRNAAQLSTVTEREQALGQARQAARVAERELRERLAEEGFDGLEALAAAELEPEALRRLAAEVEAFEAELRDSRASVQSLTEALAGQERPDLEQARTRSADAEAAWQQADAELSAAHGEFERFEGVRRELDELARRYEGIVERANAARKLRDLAAGALKGRAKIDFETFVLQSIVADVLATANERLGEMTDGRYALHLVQAEDAARNRGLELEVSDGFSGGDRRPVHTLSGGEGFLASLSLALGLSDSAQRNSGASRLGALFVDEGFGSLDAAALETVIGVLRKLHTSGRLVGVITHVDELKRRIPAQLLIEHSDRGSRIVQRLNR